ncbi:flagellar hook assembly protein FlgD [Vogesella oryzae]|uniref:flagellar hook assembly protein FlgD n=1 Tax=Vogesella oryzae TaxID=1735285 RepID=UPI001583AAC1|nr:flagellar hook capping FlgD N-terminal domain-containing protein [Vogesella oryzae]
MSTIASSTYNQTALDQINGTSGQSANAANVTSAEEIQNRFLKLLTTQMKSQDPLNPMDNSQMTTQMSQISTVSGLEKLNSTLKVMMDAQLSGQSMAAVNVIGKKVLSSGNGLNLQNGTAPGLVKLSAPADKVSVDIRDSNGKLVRSLDVAGGDAGMLSYTWDGKDMNGAAVADGSYSVQVSASNAGTAVPVTSLQGYMVSAVAFESGQPQLILSSGQRVGLTDVELITA